DYGLDFPGQMKYALKARSQKCGQSIAAMLPGSVVCRQGTQRGSKLAGCLRSQAAVDERRFGLIGQLAEADGVLHRVSVLDVHRHKQADAGPSSWLQELLQVGAANAVHKRNSLWGSDFHCSVLQKRGKRRA